MSTPAAEAFAQRMNQPLVPAPAIRGRELTHADLCDKCGAAAYVRTESYYSTLPLFWCSHHFTEHQRNGDLTGATHSILDERRFLTSAVKAQANAE